VHSNCKLSVIIVKLRTVFTNITYLFIYYFVYFFGLLYLLILYQIGVLTLHGFVEFMRKK
jgi:hypothetical protein